MSIAIQWSGSATAAYRRNSRSPVSNTTDCQTLLGACDRQQATIQRAEQDPRRVLLRLLRDESGHVTDKRTHLNDALARSGARWAVDQAVAARATVIYLEDLRSLEARGMGCTLNTRLSRQVRGKIVKWIRHLAAEVGIAVVTVPARNTSKHPPPPNRKIGRASVRRDTHQRTGGYCLAQPTGART